jgi:predicted ATPase
MITSLTLRNFKSWESSGRVEFGKITALFGSNSSGKTSFLQSLLMLKQTTDSADRGRVFDLGGQASPVSLGTFSDIVYRHESGRPVGIGVTWREEKPVEIQDTSVTTKKQPIIESSRELGLSVEVAEVRTFPVVNHVEYRLGEKSFTIKRRQDKATAKDEYDIVSEGFTFKRTIGRAWSLPHPGKFYGFPDQVRAYFQNAAFLSDLELKFEEFCSGIHYLGPLRQDPDRQYIWSGGRPVDVGRRGELAVDALIASQADGKVNSRGFAKRKTGNKVRLPKITVEQHVAAWLKELGLIHSFAVKPVDDRNTLYRVQVQRTPDSPSVLLTDVGFGVSQVLPVLVLLAYVPPGSTVLLEQPEIHLHPAVQSGLADIIIEASQARDIQVVIESHSEHLLMRLQRRLAEKDLGREITLVPDDCRLYFCEGRQISSKIQRLELDLFGNISNWPEDFFGDPFSETEATIRAAKRRATEGRS